MYIVTIDNFNGPLDLLLYLLKKDDVKIEDINIEKITKQYLDYIKHMEKLNLDVASEYLVMASELIEMKSLILLPSVEIIEEKENLIARLIEYKNYQEVTEKLKELETKRGKIYTKNPSILEDLNTITEKHEEVSVLLEAFRRLLEKQVLEKPLDTKILLKEYSINERCKEIKSILKSKNKVNFLSLFDNFVKDYVIVTFLSILDLAKKQEISIEQENNFKDIYLLNKEK